MTGASSDTTAAGPPTEAAELVERSIRKYRRSHRRYERKHPEIFNPIEQERLHGSLERAVGNIRSGRATPRALDVGCGSGNVTRHLLDLGLNVLAADVSPEFLRQVERRFAATGRLETVELNGHDLAGIPDGSVDLVCAYSVLHHIPDYLGALDEFSRVLAGGGIAYLDHEVNENFWDEDGCYSSFLRELEEHRVRRANWWNGGTWWDPGRRRWQRFLMPSKYTLKVRQFFNPAYPWDVEGDIHTWATDHIEWDLVAGRLSRAGCEVIRTEDYLNYSSAYPDAVWIRFADSCTNMRTMVARKRD